jgi:hypothetical protein
MWLAFGHHWAILTGAGRDQTLPKGYWHYSAFASSSVARAESILRREPLCVLQGSTLCLLKLKGGDRSALHRFWADWAEMSGVSGAQSCPLSMRGSPATNCCALKLGTF